MKKGFTLLEIVVSLAILALIGALALVSFVGSRTARDVDVSAQNVVSLLRLAQEKTLAGEGNSQWGVHLEQNRFVLFRGANFAGAPFTQAYALPNTTEIAVITLAGGGSDVVFARLTGLTNQSGTFVVRTKATPTQQISITIDPSGKIYQSGSAIVPTSTRIVDARHRNFTLGWSIKNSVTLLLTFSDPPNPDTLYPVVMAPYFDSGKTQFDWSGTVTIGGRAQILRVHTVALSDTNTTLSVDHDCRTNNKKLKISIDGKDIATYEADCKTITVGLFGGMMQEP